MRKSEDYVKMAANLIWHHSCVILVVLQDKKNKQKTITKRQEIKTMLLTRRNTEWLPAFMNEFWNDEYNRRTVPATNIIENEKEYRLQFAVPGMKKEEVKISLNNKVLTVAMSKEEKNEENTGKYLRKEFGHTEFSQSYTLPEDADKQAIEAKVEDGVLNITLPKLTPEKQEQAVKYIDIK